MKNIHLWRETKFVYKNNVLRGSRKTADLTLSSRLSADITARHYDLYLKQHATGRLADLGCGKVPFYQVYRPLVTEVVCVDWDTVERTNPFLDFCCDLNEPLPFKNGEFDTIILSDVLEHLRQPEKIWKEMNRILAPGGKVILNVPFFYKLHEKPFDFYRYTEFALRNFAENSGFSVVVLVPTGGVPEILTDILAKNLRFMPLAGKPLAVLLQSACRVFLKTGIGKKLSAKTGKDFPFGYFMVAEKIGKL